MTEKLTTIERRAKQACAEIARDKSGDLQVLWARSRDWGFCPRIEYRGRKVAHTSGCGYDKLSQVLADFLRFLVPEVWACGGAGVSRVIAVMRQHGWDLTYVYNGNREDFFTLKQKEKA